MYNTVLEFWFEEVSPSQWFAKDDRFDQSMRTRFTEIHARTVRCEFFAWREQDLGRLAEIIVLDQFSRNMFRGKPDAFANDQMALVLAQEAVASGVDRRVNAIQRGFFYLPFMHSESLEIHETAEKLYRQHGTPSGLEWEVKHKKIIEKFGRYPHRNKILGRESTREELAFLEQPNSSF